MDYKNYEIVWSIIENGYLNIFEFIRKNNKRPKGVITERHARALLNVPKDKLDQIFKTIIDRKYNVAKTEEYIKENLNRKRSRGVGGNAKIAINTIKQAYDLCVKSGFDVDYKETEYDDEVKLVIKIKK